jgi:hypothetical protein
MHGQDPECGNSSYPVQSRQIGQTRPAARRIRIRLAAPRGCRCWFDAGPPSPKALNQGVRTWSGRDAMDRSDPATSTGTGVGRDRCACLGLLWSGPKGAVNVKRSPAPGMPARGIVRVSPRTGSPKRDPNACEPLSTSSPTVILGPPPAVGHFGRIPPVTSTSRPAPLTGAHGALVAHDERARAGTDHPLRPSRRRPACRHGDPDVAARAANPGMKTAGGER